MIDFENYTEESIFSISTPSLEDPGSRLADFRETPFEERRKSYIHYLSNISSSLLSRLYSIASNNGSGPASSILNNVYTVIDRLETNSPQSYFYVERTKGISGNCLGTDYAYDFFRDIVGYGSRLEGLKRYDETYIDLYDDAYQVVNQVFNVLDTRGQLYGYLDQEIKILGDFLESIIIGIDSEATWSGALNIIDSNIIDINEHLDNFNDNIILGASDMRLIIEPVVKYLNLIELGSNIVETNWGSYAISGDIRTTVNKYNRVAYGFTEDYIIQAKGITSQILEQLRASVKPDRSNFELVITKSIKISFDKNNVTSDLDAVKANIIIPQF